MKKDYIVGIDFGHGETTAWLESIGADDRHKSDALRLTRVSNPYMSACPSEVYCDEKGHYSLEMVQGSKLITGMKRRPKLMTFPQKRAFKRFVRLVIHRMLRLNNDVLKCGADGTNFDLCIACPTRWNSNDKNDYLMLFKEALARTNVGVKWVINESDAAYFTHRDKKEDGVCVIVIDYGSSTIDYTVMLGDKKISDDEWSEPQLGAHNVDDEIFNLCLDSGYKEQLASQMEGIRLSGMEGVYKEEDIIPFLKNECRENKERCCTEGSYPLVGEFKFCMAKVCGNKEAFDNLRRFEFPQIDDLEMLLGKVDGGYAEGTYMARVQASFSKLKANVDEALKARGIMQAHYRIVLSGGACNMPWVNDMARQVFGPHCDIIEDVNPAFVVAKGVARYAAEQAKAIEELKEQINGEEILRKADAQAMSRVVREGIGEVVERIDAKGPMNGWDIQDEFFLFLRNMNKDNEAYSQEVYSILSTVITEEVRRRVAEAIQSTYGIAIDPSGFEYHPGPGYVTIFDASEFYPGGSLYKTVHEAVETGANTFLSFNWDKLRQGSMKMKIARAVATALQNRFNGNATEWYYKKELYEKVSAEAHAWAESLFMEKQLFKTTFLSKV